MAEWLIRLRGHPTDLEDLSGWLALPGLIVKKEGENFYLKAPQNY